MLVRLAVLVAACAVAVQIQAPQPPPSDLPDNPDVLYSHREDPASIARAMEIWSARGPSDFDAAWKLARGWYWLGTHGPERGRRDALDQGVAAGERAIQLAPDKPEGHFWTAANMGRLAESFGLRQGIKYRGRIKQELERTIAIAPGWQGGSAEAALGQWYAEVPGLFGGSHKNAEELLRRALGYDPQNKQALSFLADLLEADGRDQDARALWRRILDAPIDPEWEPEDREFQREAAKKIGKREIGKRPSISERIGNGDIGDRQSIRAVSIALTERATPRVPAFRVDPAWPKALPNHWIVGAVVGVSVDRHDHVWIVHRPSTLQPNELRSIWRAAPPVLEFDQSGALVSSWGGPGPGYEWPQLEHGIYVDADDHVWLCGGGEKDSQILEFTRNGSFLLQIGRHGQSGGSNDPQNLGAAADVVVDREANELYVADGYVNHRVIVFDATTGGYKRHWGAYGRRPDDGYFKQTGERLPGPFNGAVQHEDRPSQYDPNGPPSPQFRIVHAVRISRDGLVYVCDRTNDRIQVFRKDGTFVKEAFVAKGTFGSGSVWDLGFSVDPDQTFLFVADGTNQQIYILRRDSLAVVGSFGGAGRWAGQFYGAHNLAVDSSGNLFITETYEGKRVQKFAVVSARRSSG